jgi:hypothetical protein
MKYQKNTPLILKNIGFQFSYKHNGMDESPSVPGLHYEVWRKNLGQEIFIHATVDHAEKKVHFIMVGDFVLNGIKNSESIQLLESLILGRTTKSKNNEEGD